MTGIDAAIENLYKSFADVPHPSSIERCSHCLDDRDVSRLLKGKLRELTSDELSSYASSAFLTAGDVPDYLYFLPRILEITVKDDSWWPDIEVTGRAIRETKPKEWSQVRRDAVQGLFESVIESFLVEQYYYRIDEWICGAARADFDLGPLLQIVETNNEAILKFFNSNAAAVSGGPLGNAFWEPTDPGQDVIREWLNSEKVRRIANEAYGFTLPK